MKWWRGRGGDRFIKDGGRSTDDDIAGGSGEATHDMSREI